MASGIWIPKAGWANDGRFGGSQTFDPNDEGTWPDNEKDKYKDKDKDNDNDKDSGIWIPKAGAIVNDGLFGGSQTSSITNHS